MKNSLELDEALGYYKSGTLSVRLKDGRYARIHTRYPKVFVKEPGLWVFRGPIIVENIPEELIEKAKRGLEDPDTYINGAYDIKIKD